MDGFRAKHILYDDWLDPDVIRARCDAKSEEVLELIDSRRTDLEEYMESLKELGEKLIEGFTASNLYSELVLMCNMSEHMFKHHDRMFGKYGGDSYNKKTNTKPIFIRPISKLPYIRKKF